MSAPQNRSNSTQPRTRGRSVPAKRTIPLRLILIGVGLVVVVVVGVIAWTMRSSSGPVAETSPGSPVPTMTSADHVPDGTRVQYSTNPPTSGGMWNGEATWGVQRTPPADELMMHNLEHGGVIISYNAAKVDAPTIDKLTQLTRAVRGSVRRCVILTPRSSIRDDKPIALTSWGVLATLDAYDEAAIRAFLRDNMNNGPEKGMGC